MDESLLASRGEPFIDPATVQRAVLNQQVRILYKAPAVFLGNLILAVIVAFALRRFYSSWLDVVWLGLFLVVLARLYDFRRYRLSPKATEAMARWALRYTIGATATGCLWGLIGTALLLGSDPAHLPFITFVVAGLTAGAAIRASIYLPAMVGFALPAIGPLVVILFLLATPMSVALALVTTAIFGALYINSLHIKRWMTSIARREVMKASLTDSLRNRSELLHAVSIAAKDLLTAPALGSAMTTVLKAVGEAIGADRVLVFESRTKPTERYAPRLRYAWNSVHAPVVFDAHAMADAPDLSGDPLFAPLVEGKSLCAIPTKMPDGAAKSMFLNLGIQSALLVPITVAEEVWGHIGLDDCTTERAWSGVERDILRTVADMIGAAITRERYVKKIRDANAIVESSPTVLFRLRGEPSLPLIYISHNVTMYGYDPAALIASPKFYQTIIHPDDASRVMQSLTLMAAEGDASAHDEFRMQSKDGAYIWLECRYTPIRDAGGRLLEIEGLLTDITDRKNTSEKINFLATTDAVTGLANRASFIDRLSQAFAAAQRDAPPFAILYLDLDRFKDINDTLGHSAGDWVLKTVSERLRSCVRETDLVGRLGGDEFAVLQANMSDLTYAGVLASKIQDALSVPIPFGNTDIRLTVSIGVSAYTHQSQGPDEMLAQADIALYRAKEEGRNQYCFHNEQLNREAKERVSLTNDLRRAFERNELELYFQPLVELSTGQIVGMEAQIRWRHPMRGLLQSIDFLPVIESTPLGLTLAEWVLDHACEQMHAWKEVGIALPIVAVKLSIRQLQTPRKTVEFVARTLTKWGVPPENLELDVNEAMLAYITSRRGAILDALQQLGVKIGVDDLATQFSSLDYLRIYHISRVKVPQALIGPSARDPEASAMVRAIIGLAGEFGIDVVAQEVETDAQHDLLSEMAFVTKAQGPYYSAPIPAREAKALITSRMVQPPPAQTSGTLAVTQ